MERSQESLRHHFEVERELAEKLRNSRREDRPVLVPRLYAELYQRVPDHPRSDRARNPEAAAIAVRGQTRLLAPYLAQKKTFVEFGAGSGALCGEIARQGHNVTAVEVCEQGEVRPEERDGVRWVYHDGLSIPLPDAAFDLAFSYQVLEHVHPDDVPVHLSEAARILRPGGTYVLSTPHAFSGPHDISRHFGHELKTFHLKEWTYRELRRRLLTAGFTRCGAYFKGRPAGGLGLKAWLALESCLRLLPPTLRRVAARRILNNVVLTAVR